ncbi:MAG TPA: hypothetical protein VKB08_06545 [Bradyrhizobium sp.]|nr:hypothetical protein [Bradyrhizobium sp.]
MSESALPKSTTYIVELSGVSQRAKKPGSHADRPTLAGGRRKLGALRGGGNDDGGFRNPLPNNSRDAGTLD